MLSFEYYEHEIYFVSGLLSNGTIIFLDYSFNQSL
jgi:hypothetical protein